MFRVGVLQFRPIFGKPSKNLNLILSALKNATADLIVLPELAFTGYFFRDRSEVMAFSEDPNQSSIIEALTEFCHKKNCNIVTGFAEKSDHRYYNSAILINSDGLKAVYRKIHLFNNEKMWFDPGYAEPEVQMINGVTIGIMICWDWTFPEVARILALKGAEILCHPSNLVLDLCQRTMIGRSIENGIFTITANRFGKDTRPHGELKFTGRSQIVDPDGKILFQAKSASQSYFEIDIDPAKARNKQRTPENHLFNDRKIELYKLLTGG